MRRLGSSIRPGPPKHGCNRRLLGLQSRETIFLRGSTMRRRRFILLFGTFLLAAATSVRAQSGSTLTPDDQSFMVNKDIGEERWTIILTLAQIEPPIIASIRNRRGSLGLSPPPSSPLTLRSILQY